MNREVVAYNINPKLKEELRYLSDHFGVSASALVNAMLPVVAEKIKKYLTCGKGSLIIVDGEMFIQEKFEV
jgi:hypothetical protein